MSDKIIDRVRKLMALANDTRASDGERDNALRMAHATLAKYNLSMAEVELREGAQEKRTTEDFRGKNQPWTRQAAFAVAQLFFCNYFYQAQGSYVKHNFIGKQSNAITAREIAEFVIKSILSEATKRSKDADDPGSYWTQFCKGAARRVVERCTELRTAAERESQQSASTGTSLVLASVYQSEKAANDAYISDILGLTLKSAKSRERYTGSAGLSDGHNFGSSISLHRQAQDHRVRGALQ
jgi:hypothetical protein